MRTPMSSSRRVALPLLLGLVSLIACDTANVPEPNPGRFAANTANAAKSGGTGMVPFADSGSFHATADAGHISCAPTANNQVRTPTDKYIGSGPGTHVGMSILRFSFTYCTTINMAGPDGYVLWTTEGPFTIEAANGDELEGFFYATQFATGNFRLDSVNVTGGTGRFANASGRLNGQGYINTGILAGWYKMSGLITRPNS